MTIQPRMVDLLRGGDSFCRRSRLARHPRRSRSDHPGRGVESPPAAPRPNTKKLPIAREPIDGGMDGTRTRGLLRDRE